MDDEQLGPDQDGAPEPRKPRSRAARSPGGGESQAARQSADEGISGYDDEPDLPDLDFPDLAVPGLEFEEVVVVDQPADPSQPAGGAAYDYPDWVRRSAPWPREGDVDPQAEAWLQNLDQEMHGSSDQDRNRRQFWDGSVDQDDVTFESIAQFLRKPPRRPRPNRPPGYRDPLKSGS